MRRRVFCLCLMVVPNWAFGQTWECREVMVPMRDGVELATDVYVPENQFEGPYPVLIERTPYNKRGCEHLHARYFVKRGYVVLIQDERGRYNSEGTYYWLHPDGYSQTLRQNILRARYREGDEAPVFMKPGEIYPFEIEMYPISNVFLEGHRIRIVVSSSSFPKWYPNGNTGKEMDEDFPGVVAKNSIFHDREHPSKVVLPVIPRGETTN